QKGRRGEIIAVVEWIVIERDAELPQVVFALGAVGGLADLLDRGQKQPDENGDDGDDDQELDQGEGGRAKRCVTRAEHGTSPFCRAGQKRSLRPSGEALVRTGPSPCRPDA